MKRLVISLVLAVYVMCLCSCKDDIVQRAKKANLIVDTFDDKPAMELAESKEFEAGNTAMKYCYYQGFLYYLISDKSINIAKYNTETGESSEMAALSLDENDDYALDSVISLNVNDDKIVLHCLAMQESENISDNASDNYMPIKLTYDMSGNKESEVTFEEDDNISIIRKCVTDNDGNTYFLAESENGIDSFLIKYDIKGKKKCVVKMANYGDDIGLCNGKIVMYRYDMEKEELGFYDIENDTYEPSGFADIYPNELNSRIVGAYNSKTLIMSNARLYSYDPVTNELIALIDMNKNSIDCTGVRYVEQTSDDEVIIIYSPDGFTYEIMYFRKE